MTRAGRRAHADVWHLQVLMRMRSPGTVLFLATAMALASGGCASLSPRCDTRAHVPRLASTALEASVFIVGDAGEQPARGDLVLQSLTGRVSQAARELGESKVSVVFLGDNIYPRGLPDKTNSGYSTAKDTLNAQLELANTGADVLITPGNHDWHKSGRDGRGLAAIKRQSDHVEKWARATGNDARFLPAPGCPVPEIVEFGRHLAGVFLDTEWWLYPNRGEPSCALQSRSDLVRALRESLSEVGEREVVVFAHHPLISMGNHGGRYSWKQWWFPAAVGPVKWLYLPLPGAEPFLRWLFNYQDLHGGLFMGRPYPKMRQAAQKALAANSVLAWVGGHEHNLQLTKSAKGARYHLVSGTGSYDHRTPVGCSKDSIYGGTGSGYMRLDADKEGRFRLAVFEVGRNEEVFSTWLDRRQ